jgi:hypothetical protein
MKILALERDVNGVDPKELVPHLPAEARRVWELYQEGIIREMYFREDRTEAVLVLECRDREEASNVLRSLPLVSLGLIAFDLIPLVPYPGFARLFG